MADRGDTIGVRMVRCGLAIVWLVLSLLGAVQAQEAQLYDIDLPAQPVPEALNGLSEQTGVPVFFPYDLARDLNANRVVGRHALLEALKLLLHGTGLSGGLSENGVLMISIEKPKGADIEEKSMNTTEHSPDKDHRTNIKANQKTQEKVRKGFLAGIVAFLSAATTPPAAVAQQTDSVLLEEVVVTARKVEESLMDVPIAISVVGGDVVQDGNIGQLATLAPTLPNFHHSESVSGNDQIFMRGVGSGSNFGFENSVGQVFDGIFFGRARFGRALFMDLERIEVLKGPQGALIGKNTTAGAVNITSAKPTEEFEAYLVPTWEFEGDDGPTIEGAVSGPLTERVRGRIAFRYEDRDGYLTNLVRNTEEMQREEVGIRVQLAADLAEGMDATFLFQYSDQTREGRPVELTKCLPAYAAAVAPFGDDCQWNRTNSRILLENGVEDESATNTETHLAGLTVNWDTPLGVVTSVTAYTRYETRDRWDPDNIAIEFANLDIREKFEQWSEEIRLTSTGENVIDYTLGAYFQFVDQQTIFATDYNFMGPRPLFPVFPPVARARGNQNTFQESDTQAVFGQVTWHALPKWDFTAGFRFTHEGKEASQQQFPSALFGDGPAIPPPPFGPAAVTHDVSGDRTENQFTPNGTIQWRPNDDAMLYLNVAKGFKGGGFDHQVNAPQAVAERDFQFEDETVVAYEVGGKFEFPDQGVRMGVTLFRSEFDDLQVSSLITTAFTSIFRVGNAASATSQGVEVDGTWRPLDNLTINAAAAYLDAEFDEYANAPCYGMQTVAEGCIGGNQDLSGGVLQFSPEWSWSLDGTYVWQLPNNLSLSLFGRVYYSDEYLMSLDTDPNNFQDAYTKIDATMSLGSNNGRWQLSLIGRNLTDKKTANYATSVQGGLAHQYFTEPPRSLALQARIEY